MIRDPKPGSKEAVAAGCNCPVHDNNNGEGIPMVHPDTKEIQLGYWMTADCVIHGITEKPLTPATETE